ncbi:DUF5719 family protein [Zafaria sp. Z1313]|uniref:DUF5719 family protein n=1 Tax=unclassified Zafaria TaxID=2828765 RepID=UPI002E75AE6E|nr:DUF5719 family protein [Zafaria sp. J156]MEE1619948.1 DUF5719 family protein [Zafaria sp. J156]
MTATTQRRKRGRIAAAAAGAALVLGTGGGVAAAAWLLPGPGTADGAVPRITLPAGDFVASCPEAPRVVEGTTAEGTDPAFGSASSTERAPLRAVVVGDAAERIPGSVVSDAEGGEVQRLAPAVPDAEAAQEAAASADGFSGRSAAARSGIESGGPTALTVQPLGGFTSVAGMARGYEAEDGDLAGLASSRCQSPSHEQWLVGASTELGRMALLVVTNPSASASTVDLEVHGPTGPIDSGATRGIVLAPGESKRIVLAGLAADEPAVSVHVVAKGAPVVSVIQQSVLRGLVPGGVEYIEPSAAPADGQTVAGVLVQDPEATAHLDGDEYADASTALQVTVPGTEDAVLNVRAFGTGGEAALPGDGVHSVEAGQTVLVPLDSLGAGTYTVNVQADQPLVAAVRTVWGNAESPETDLAWMASAERLGSEHLVVVPETGTARLAFGSVGGESTITLRPVSADGGIGAETTLQTSGGTTLVQDITRLGGDTVAVIVGTSGDPVYGGLVGFQPRGTATGTTLPPATPSQRSVVVDVTP